MAPRHDRRLDCCAGRKVITVDDIARVLAWANGGDATEIAAAPSDILIMDDAQQCLEDLGGVS